MPDDSSILELEECFLNMSGNLLDMIIEFRMQSHNNGVGGGEFAAMCLFSGAINSEIGDVEIDDHLYEIKSNRSMIKSEKIINGIPSFQSIIHVLPSYLESIGMDVLLKDHPATSFNFTQKGLNFLSEKLGSEHVLNISLKLMPGLSDEETIIIKESVEMFSSGNTDSKTLINKLSYVAFKHYAELEKFEGMMVFSPSSRNVLYLDKDCDYEFFSENIDSLGGPTFSDSRSSIGFKIRASQI